MNLPVFVLGCAVLLGNVLALVLHGLTWRLRRRAMAVMVAFGMLSLICCTVLALAAWGLVSSGGLLAGLDGEPPDFEAIRQGHLGILRFVAVTVVATALLAELHARQIPAPAVQAFVAIWTEIFAGLWISRGLNTLSWAGCSFWLSLITLAILPPRVRKLIFQFCRCGKIE